jgi:amino acid transporter
MDRDDPPFPPQRPLEKHARIEADLFCTQCGYNLHSQPVVRDERLGILVVRCTECGRYQPAGAASNAGRVWLGRLATITLAVWILVVTAFVVGSTFGLGGLQVAHVEIFSIGGYVGPNGQRVFPSWDAAGRKRVWVTRDDEPIAVENPPWQRTFVPLREVFQDRVAAALLGSLMCAAPVIFGGVMAAIMWHVPRRRYWMLAALPVLAGMFVIAGFHVDESSRGGDISVVVKIVVVAAMGQIAFITLGTLIGRPIARALATLFVPPRPRQALAFLWTADGKSPPAAQDPVNPRSS